MQCAIPDRVPPFVPPCVAPAERCPPGGGRPLPAPGGPAGDGGRGQCLRLLQQEGTAADREAGGSLRQRRVRGDRRLP